MAACLDIRRSGRTALVMAMSAGLAAAAPASAAAADAADGRERPETGCSRSIASSETAQRIPAQLLTAISLAESGRWDSGRGAIVAWPWTVTAGGKGRFLETKEAAVALVERLRARGVRNIDVGCMQVNLHFHPDAFASLESAFDPARNVAYAARFLKRLRQQKRSWSQAVGHYHSATRAYNRAYREKVFRLWNEARRRAAEARRQAVIRAYRARRAEQEALRAARAEANGPS